MNTEELTKYKHMSMEDIDSKMVPDIEEIKEKRSTDPISVYFMKVGNVVVKSTYAVNGRTLEECFLSYLTKKAMLMD